MPAKKPIWIPSLFPKQIPIFNCYKRIVLASGSRKSGKTIAVIHRVVRHLWETPGAVVGIFSKILRTAKDTGVWQDFMEIVLPEWMGRTINDKGDEVYVPRLYNKFGQPFEFTSVNSQGTPGPKCDSITRSMYFRVRNYWGGESKLLLFSLDNEAEAPQRLKSTRFSMLYFPELSEFKTDAVYKIGFQQLRMFHLEKHQHQWIGDTNPSEEGEDSWIYDLFYRQRLQADHPEPIVQKEIELFELFLDDNPTLDEFDKASLRQAYAGDEGEYQRNVNGLWVKGHGKIGKVFADLWNPRIHVIADYIDIAIGTSEFFSGWDVGEVNNAAAMLEKRMVPGETLDKPDRTVWLVFSETVSINLAISTEAFTHLFVDELKKVEAFYKQKILFTTHWSDDTAINKYRATADTYDYLVVREASGGEIELEGVQKPDGSIGARVRMMRQLLMENRLFIGSNCPNAIEMFEGLMKGGNDPIAKNSRLKHIFDAISYPIFMESLADMDSAGRPKSRSDSLISV